MKSTVELTELFRANGLKVTPQRQAIFRALVGNESHPTAEGVYAQVATEMPTISLRTVYSTLHDLADMGELTRLDLGTGSSRFDPNQDPHHHLVCESCGTIADLDGDLADLRVLERDAQGFRVSSTEVTFRGVCRSCRQAAGDPVS